jgi:hypothetical protein
LRKKSKENKIDAAKDIDFSKIPDIKDFTPVREAPPPVPHMIDNEIDNNQSFGIFLILIVYCAFFIIFTYNQNM